MKKLLFCFIISFITPPIFPSEKGLIELAEYHYNKKEYYNSITESMRYQFLYPQGSLFSKSLLIMSKSYYKGGNKEKALFTLSECFEKFTNNDDGQIALFYNGLIRLESGSYNLALKSFLEYDYIYNNGIYKEDALINLTIAYSITGNYEDAEKVVLNYKKTFPNGKYQKKMDELSILIDDLKLKPEKNPFIAGLSSAIIPGSGYFYTEKYMLGIFSFLTNSALIYGIYDGYKKRNQFQMIFFSVIELSFYNYSIIGSVKSVNEYNTHNDLKRDILLGFKTTF